MSPLTRLPGFALALAYASLILIAITPSSPSLASSFDDGMSPAHVARDLVVVTRKPASEGGAMRGTHDRSLATTVSASMVVLAPATTEGPYFESLTDWMYSTDLVAAGRAGASGRTTDRTSVVNGVPLNLTLNIFSVSGSVATGLAGADVFLWGCDAAGTYSATNVNENLEGQKWMRSYYTTDENGSVTFKLIMPGWYTGRTVHLHVRVRLATAASLSFAATTQLFVSAASLSTYQSRSPYSSNSQTQTALASDGIYTGISASVRDSLVLNLTGSASTAYAASVNLGIADASTATKSPTAPTATSSASPTTVTGGSTLIAAASRAALTTATLVAGAAGFALV